MKEIQIFKNEDLILKVNPTFDPSILNLSEWEPYLDILCSNREYQKKAIKNAIIFLCGGKYNSTEDLAEENYLDNKDLQAKYSSLNDFKSKLQIKNKLFANIDLATGTGKSYVIYGLAQILLGLGVVDQVLVLCPSLTIEAGLKEKFESLSGDSRLKSSIPNASLIKNPRIVDANVTIKKGDICVENIHAVYEKTGSSINDSLKGKGQRTLVLNDESHHIFNSSTDKDVKKWKDFLISKEYDFKYMLGFTGTAYIENDYFNDVIYRYSLKRAIEENVIKNIDYVQKDDSSSTVEKFQKIYQNHIDNKEKYPLIKPMTILVTKDISKAKSLTQDIIDFLCEKEALPRENVEKKVLIVTSHNDHKMNVVKLKNVDNKNDSYEWIVSVSMLTEGWDVKNVFQIVPWEDKAFNSKLLIAQVLGRGLRIPLEHSNPQPKVIVFNHDSWSRNIRGLVEEILEIETRLYSGVILDGERSKYNFTVHNLNYDKVNEEIEHENFNKKYNYSRMLEEGIALEAQVIRANKETAYETLTGGIREKGYTINYDTFSIDEIVDKIYDEFNIREWEGRTLQLGEEEYTKNDLPERSVIRNIIRKSMDRVGINGEELVEKNRLKILQSFGTMLRKKGKTVVPVTLAQQPYKINTTSMMKESIGLSSVRRDSTVYFSTNYKNEISIDQKEIIDNLIADESLPRSAWREKNEYLFKTPLSMVFTKNEPERKFVDLLCKEENASLYERWIKSRDVGFYSLEYTWRKSSHQIKNLNFNPDFFVKIIKNDFTYYLVIEIKADKDDSDENKAKYKYAKDHFENLNQLLEENGTHEKYLFHFLSPNSYIEFFDYLSDGRIFESQEIFRCELENMLEE